jgi:hypothetical protein
VRDSHDRGRGGEISKTVAIESPFGSKDPAILERNKAYALAAMRDCLARGESPYASHLLLTQVLDDNDPEQRTRGIQAGLDWAVMAERRVVYVDLGTTVGMQLGIAQAEEIGQPIERRTIPGWGGK